jgi:lipopolysaccharide/colanic/teichoic acid biosynthesis glycosyltransferase
MTMRASSGSMAVVSSTPAFGVRFHSASVPGIYGRDEFRLALLVKRVLDLTAASLLLLLSLPLLVLSMLAIRVTNAGPVMFRQRRVGLNGAEFTMYKLRTMSEDAEQLEPALAAQRPGRVFFKKHSDPRVTFVGKWLRKYSIDEIPQFINVVLGDMSLVGPRPLLSSDWQNFPRDRRRRRITMKPGLTGLWQVNGRSLCSDDERMRLDVEYVDHWSLTLDIKILLRTPTTVLTARGAC